MKAESMSTLPSHSIANKWQSAGCTGISLKALFISIFAKRGPEPNSKIMMASSIVTYIIEHRSFSTPSFTLLALGYDRSTISCHLWGW